MKDPSPEPVQVPLRTQDERSPSQEAGNNSFLILHLETTLVSGKQQIDPNGLQVLRTQSREDTTDEFQIERNSCLVLNLSTYVSSVIFVNQT